MKKIASITAISVLTTVLSSGHAQAAPFTESGDAGETLSTAQVVTLSDSTLLESISGMLSDNDDADLFQIFLTGGQTFSATTVGGASFDTQLFLFDSTGMGVYGNDNSGSSNQSTLPSGFSPVESSIYYLAISGFDYDPISVEGDIFPDFPEVSFDEVVGPTGPGGGSPLSEFDGARLGEVGSYTILLSQGQPVPESSSVLGTLALGAWGLSSLLKKKTKQT